MRKTYRKFIAVIVTFGVAFAGFSQVVINEYSCSNMSGIADAFGQYEDWIELYNTTGSSVNLTGWYLSDHPLNLTKWQIPSGSIPANGYKMVFCSKRDLVNGNEYHPNFNLSQTDGEWIILTNPTLGVVDSFKIVHRTQANHSIGRTSNAAATFSLFSTPTPNSANTNPIPFYTPTPVFSLAPGFYTGPQTVTIQCANPSANIRYTLDGSNPNPGSTLYTGAIALNTTTVLRATAYVNGQLPSFTETNTYFINVSHSVPVVSVCSAELYDLLQNGNQSPPDRVGSFEFFESNGSFIDEAQGDFNKHGNDSWAYPQRGFDYICRDQYGYNGDINHPIFPEKTRGKFQRLILKAGASDNYPFEQGAHIRDAFVHTLSIRSDLRLDERTWRPAVVYLNGNYWGVYDIREKVDDPDYTEYYYGQNQYNLHYLKTWGATWEEYGAPNAAPDWNALRTYIMSNNMGVPANFNYVDSLLNWKSMADYFMLNSFCVNQDWLNWNTAWWRGLDTANNKHKWRYTLWDLDATFGHYINYTGIPDPSANANPCNAEALPNPGGQGHTEILGKLLAENPAVKQYYVTRYADLLNTSFSCAKLIPLLDSMIHQIDPEMAAHCARWGGSYAGWQSSVTALKDFINQRCGALQQGLIDCYQLTGPYQVVFKVSPAGAGNIQVNSIHPSPLPWTTTYFGGIETLLDASANAGFVFSHWDVAHATPGMADTLHNNYLTFNGPDTVVAVFVATILDSDGDGLSDSDEALLGTDPNNPDSDGDGYSDGQEIMLGSNPLDACDPDDSGEDCFDGIHFPTAFSPDGIGDPLNENYAILVGKDVKEFVFYIYDRWGNVLFKTLDKKAKWDGSYQGILCNSGVYAYMAEAVLVNGNKKVYSGNLTLIR